MSPSFPYLERARLSREAHAAFREAFAKVRRRDKESDPVNIAWRESILAHGASVAAAYPPEFWIKLEALRDGDATHIDAFIEFLEADPRFFGSGYTKTRVIRYLKRQPCSDRQQRRLRALLLHLVSTRGGREIADYARLALRVDSDELRRRLWVIAGAPDRGARQRANRILSVLPERIGGPPRNWRWAVSAR